MHPQIWCECKPWNEIMKYYFHVHVSLHVPIFSGSVTLISMSKVSVSSSSASGSFS